MSSSRVGELIRARREALGLSQRELGDLAGIGQNYISRLERGEVGLPQRQTIDALARALNLAPRAFYVASGALDGVPAEPPRQDAFDDLLAAIRVAAPQTAAMLEQVRRRESPEAFQAAIRQIAPAVGVTIEGFLKVFEAGEEEGRQRRSG